jgi:hypothetical protein
MVRSMVLEGTVWGPHSLHTAEATGSKPVTPTSTNASPHSLRRPFASTPLLATSCGVTGWAMATRRLAMHLDHGWVGSISLARGGGGTAAVTPIRIASACRLD